MTVRRGGLALGLVLVAAAAIAALFTGRAAPDRANAASHREAPLISLDPAADISDFFAFRSYESGKADRVVFIVNVNPGAEPSSAPNYYAFDPSVTYSIGIDNNRDGKADDVRFDFRFKNEIRGLVKDLKLPLRYVGGGPLPVIDDVDDPGNGLRQTYEVTMTTKGSKFATKLHEGSLPVLPENVGPRTTPNYEANLLSEGIRDLQGGGRVFAGPRDDPFYIDLGATFDTLNFAPFSSPKFGAIDMLAGHNVSTIALEVPMSWISGGSTAIGAYGFTSRPVITVRGGPLGFDHGEGAAADLGRKLGLGDGGGLFDLFGGVQVQRLANPLINELIIGTVDKDRWNGTKPDQESQFLDYFLKPRLALAEQLVFGIPTGCLVPLPGCTPNPPANAGLDLAAFNRTDLQAVLLQYNGIFYGAGPGGVNSELLRLNLTTPPTPLAMQSSVHTALGGTDPAAWPNGRRPKDDVTDIAAKAVGGPNYLPVPSIDGVEDNDKAYPASFPFLASPHDGVFRVHENR
jgi:hypothetical protein